MTRYKRPTTSLDATTNYPIPNTPTPVGSFRSWLSLSFNTTWRSRHKLMSKPIDKIPEADRPREKLLRKGAPALSDQELLAVLLGKGTPRMDVMTLAGKLARLSDEKGLKVQAEDLTQFEG